MASAGALVLRVPDKDSVAQRDGLKARLAELKRRRFDNKPVQAGLHAASRTVDRAKQKVEAAEQAIAEAKELLQKQMDALQKLEQDLVEKNKELEEAELVRGQVAKAL